MQCAWNVAFIVSPPSRRPIAERGSAIEESDARPQGKKTVDIYQ